MIYYVHTDVGGREFKKNNHKSSIGRYKITGMTIKLSPSII